MRNYKRLVAVVKNENNETEILRYNDYYTKKDFAEDLRLNGLRIKYNYIFTESEYEEFEQGYGKIYDKIEKRMIDNEIRSKAYYKIKKEMEAYNY